MVNILNLRLIAKKAWIFTVCACLLFLYITYNKADTKFHTKFNGLSSTGFSSIKNKTLSQKQTLLNATDRIIKAKILEGKSVGILIPSTTRKIKVPALHTLSLTSLCLPSIYKTIENKYVYNIYIGIDREDYLYSVKREIETSFHNTIICEVPGKTFVKAVNALARKAYEEGMDYILRINDDTSFETKNWTSASLTVLQSYSPPNIGVVGPTCKSGNTAILTHDFVHRTHLDIFGFYYPPFFDNWWADDWITNVYTPWRSTKLESWVVSHHLKFHGTRYNVDFKKKHQLENIVFDGKNKLREYISSLKQ